MYHDGCYNTTRYRTCCLRPIHCRLVRRYPRILLVLHSRRMRVFTLHALHVDHGWVLSAVIHRRSRANWKAWSSAITQHLGTVLNRDEQLLIDGDVEGSEAEVEKGQVELNNLKTIKQPCRTRRMDLLFLLSPDRHLWWEGWKKYTIQTIPLGDTSLGF